MPSKPLRRRALRQAQNIRQRLEERMQAAAADPRGDRCAAVFVRDTESRHPIVLRLDELGGAAVLSTLTRRKASTIAESLAPSYDPAVRVAVLALVNEGTLVLERYAQPWQAAEAARRGNPFALLVPLGAVCHQCGAGISARTTAMLPRRT